MQELPAEISAVVRDVAVERLGIGWLARLRGRRELGMGSPPVDVEELLQAAVGKAQELQADVRPAELADRGARLGETPLAVGDVLGRTRPGQPGRVDDRLDVAVGEGRNA